MKNWLIPINWGVYFKMEWEEFLNGKIDEYTTGQIQTDIKCPKCGRNIYLNSIITLTSYPERYVYWCSCGWQDCAPQKWSKKN